MDYQRKLASIRKISDVKAIEGADRIVAYQVDGWWVVDQKDKYKLDDLVVYCEVDSWLPHSIAPFLTKPGQSPKVFEGVEGQRLRTVKLKGQLSQGLLLKIPEDTIKGAGILIAEGLDLTAHLGIIKYEKPLPAQLSGMAKGNFPSFIPKTDQPRIQNIKGVIEECKAKGYTFEKTEKLDGSSLTVYVNKGAFGVCSRNLDLQYDLGNTFWKTAVMQGLVSTLLQYYLTTGRSLALQGEMLGEGIQGNSYKISGSEFYLFDIWDIDRQKYLAPKERTTLMAEDFWGIEHVPIVNTEVRLEVSIEEMLHQAEGNSFVNREAEREGFVYKCNEDPSISFKCISNAWLLKND